MLLILWLLERDDVFGRHRPLFASESPNLLIAKFRTEQPVAVSSTVKTSPMGADVYPLGICRSRRQLQSRRTFPLCASRLGESRRRSIASLTSQSSIRFMKQRLAAATRRQQFRLAQFLVLAHDRRRTLPFNVTAHPTADWTGQQVREAFPFAQPPRIPSKPRARCEFLLEQKAGSARLVEVGTLRRK